MTKKIIPDNGRKAYLFSPPDVTPDIMNYLIRFKTISERMTTRVNDLVALHAHQHQRLAQGITIRLNHKLARLVSFFDGREIITEQVWQDLGDLLYLSALMSQCLAQLTDEFGDNHHDREILEQFNQLGDLLTTFFAHRAYVWQESESYTVYPS